MGLTGLVLLFATLFRPSEGYPEPGVCGLFDLRTQYHWSNLKFAVPSGFRVDPSYTSNNTHITGLEEAGGYFFLSTPRLKGYNPATLAKIPTDSSVAGSTSPILEPYPDISWHQLPSDGADINCNTTLVSVHRTQVDGCNRLWVLDSGTVNVLRNTTRICPAKIVVFDLTTNQVERLIIIPKDLLTPISVLIYLVLDNTVVSTSSSSSSGSNDSRTGSNKWSSEGGRQSNSSANNCDNMFVYIAARFLPAVIVYNSQANQFYRISSPYMYPDPSYPFIQRIKEIDGQRLTVFVGLLGMTVSGSGNSRSMYLQPVASLYIYSIPTSFLQAGPYQGDESQVPVSRVVSKSSGGFGLNTDPISGCILYNQITQKTINTYSPVFRTTRTVASGQQIEVIFDFAIRSDNIKQKYAVSVDLLQYYHENQTVDQKIFSLSNV